MKNALCTEIQKEDSRAVEDDRELLDGLPRGRWFRAAEVGIDNGAERLKRLVRTNAINVRAVRDKGRFFTEYYRTEGGPDAIKG